MRELTGTHVLVGLILFFGVMLAANGAFVYFATTTFSGLSTQDPYRKGLAYNQTLEAFRAQQATGWHASAAVSGQAVRLTVTDSGGAPVQGLEVSGRLGRPATDAQDHTLTFRAEGQGRYVAAVGPLAPGRWDLAAEARPYGSDHPTPFKVTARLWVPQP